MRTDQFVNKVTKQHGLTLIEMMVALVLSLVIMGGVIQIFISNKATYRMNESMSRVQENGRFAISFLSQDIRMVGFMGCASGISSVTNNVKPGAFSASQVAAITFSGSDALEGYSYTTGALPSDLTDMGMTAGSIVTNTDAIVMKVASPCDGGGVVPPVMGGTAANIKIADAAACGLAQNSVVMISDCSGADVFSIVNNPLSGGGNQDTLTHSSANNNTNNLSKKYLEDATVYNYRVNIYYIGNNAEGIPSLYRRIFNGNTNTYDTQELVEGVENMQILYGEDIDTNESPAVADRYVSAADVTDWGKIVSARITLLLRTIDDNVASEKVAYTYNGSTTAAASVPDQRLRRVFTTTIGLRNRIL